MQLIAATLLALHGIAHLVGFREAFWPSPHRIAKASFLGRKVDGIVWLLLALGFLGSAILLVTGQASWPTLLLGSTSLSLVMCLLAWPDARIGAVIDAVLLVLVLLLYPSNNGQFLAATLEREVRVTPAPAPVLGGEPIDEATIVALPEPVKRYLRFMGVLGRPRDWSLRAAFSARFRRSEGEWLACEALQYDTRQPVARTFLMQLSLYRILPVTVRDKYASGRGTMLARAFDLFTVVEGHGYELDVGELVTYLNDAILMAPSLVLGPETTWTAVSGQAFDVTLRDADLSVSARVWLDERGAPTDFSTRDRFFEDASGKWVRTEWRTPISGWQDVGGRKLPTRAQAVWHLPTGPFPYADFAVDPARVAFNVPPV